MKSPFLGMDPYVESVGLWRNFHANLMIKVQDALADVVPRHYLVRAEERAYLLLTAENGKEVREFYPDVRVLDREPGAKKRGKRRPRAEVAARAAVVTEQRPM